jgi:hypothetical protein
MGSVQLLLPSVSGVSSDLPLVRLVSVRLSVGKERVQDTASSARELDPSPRQDERGTAEKEMNRGIHTDKEEHE